jgi:hypothetical protein
MGKSVSRRSVITEEFIDDNRRDVSAISALALKLLDELSEHPIALPPNAGIFSRLYW